MEEAWVRDTIGPRGPTSKRVPARAPAVRGGAPSTANSAAWLVLAVIAFNLTRTAGVIADHAGRLAKAMTARSAACRRWVWSAATVSSSRGRWW